jgi:hypothetical protein
MSGLSRTPGKRVWANTHRGFESRPLRQIQNRPLWAVFYLVEWVCKRNASGSTSEHRSRRMPKAVRVQRGMKLSRRQRES